VKLTGYALVGVLGSAAFGLASFVIGAFSPSWTTLPFIAPGALLTLGISIALERMSSPASQFWMVDYMGNGPGPIAGMIIVASFVIWAAVIGLIYGWVRSAPKGMNGQLPGR
jgi:hypothetical protein